MSTEVEYEKREIYSQMFRAFFYTVLFLVMVMMCGCGGGGGSAADAGKSSAAKVLASIVVQPADNKLAVGKTQQFTAIGKYSDGTLGTNLGSSVSWLSSAPSVASITPNGMVSALAVGQTTITASYGGVTGITTLTVPDTRLVSITITPANQLIATGTTEQYSAIGAYSDGTFQALTSSVTWDSSNNSVATITADGKATAGAVGSTTITAVLGSITSNPTLLTVSAVPLVGIDVTPITQIVAVGMTKQYKATGTFSGGLTQDLTTLVNWDSSSTAVATIDTNGKASAVGLGATVITASLGGVTSPAASLTVKPLSSIDVASIASSVTAGTILQFTASGTFTDSTTQDLTDIVTWSSSDSSVAKIGQDGMATAVNTGSTTITASSGVISGSQTLSVTPVDMTGTWEGTYNIYDSVVKNEIGTYTFQFVINQNGANVTGTTALRFNTAGQLRADGQFTAGTVTGRQIDFIFSYSDPRTSHLMVNIGSAIISKTISESTMTGNVLENFNGGYNCSYIFTLKKL